MLAKLIGGALSYAPRKIVVGGKTIFNPSGHAGRCAGRKAVRFGMD